MCRVVIVLSFITATSYADSIPEQSKKPTIIETPDHDKPNRLKHK